MEQLLSLLRLCKSQITAQPAGSKIGAVSCAPYDHVPRLEFSSVANTVLLPAAPPPEPVRETCGKNAAFALDLRIRGDEVLFRLEDVRTPLKERRR